MALNENLRILVWQWGRRGAGPRYAAELVRAFSLDNHVDALLSLSSGAELLRTSEAPACALPVRTYAGLAGFVSRVATAPLLIVRLSRLLRRQRIDIALCAMPAAMDFIMAGALRLAGIPYAVVVHEADLHPGDNYPTQILLQRSLVRGSVAVFALSSFVARRLHEKNELGRKRLLRTSLPPFHLGPDQPPPRAHGGPLRLLSFGRLLPYKGLDLLAESLALLGEPSRLEVRVVGSGPESADLDRLRALPNVVVENRWVDEEDVSGLLGWADALILAYREASQSGVAAAAIAAQRWVVSTRVGGLPEQLALNKRAILCDATAASLADGLQKLLDRSAGETEAGETSAPPWPHVAGDMIADLRQLVRTPAEKASEPVRTMAG